MQAVIQFPDLSPELFSISLFGMEFALRWYALAYIAGIVIAWRLGVAAVRRPALWRDETPVMTPAQIEEMLTWIILGVILGGRLGFVLFYQPAYYLANPAEIVMVWQGGMAFHGGLIGVIVAAWIFVARNGLDRLGTADLIAHAVPVGLLLGRLANFINAELWGHPTDVPWAVIFPYVPHPRHPSQLYEAFSEGLLLFLIILWAFARKRWDKSPGKLTGLFLTGYATSRFFVEFFREPDAQLGHLWLHMTMGQWLTIPMILIGLYLLTSRKINGICRTS